MPAPQPTPSTRKVSANTPAVKLSDVEFAWPGRSAFDIGVPEFEMRKGERLFLFGESGAGKSTLLSLICGIVEADSGTVNVLGNDLGKLSGTGRDRFRAEHVGVVFQMFNLLPYASPRDNIFLPLSFAPARRERAGPDPEMEADRLAESMGLAANLLTRRTSTDLSVGQQQRVAVARALIGNPPLIIADEPTSALDTNAQQHFIDLLFSQLDQTGSSLIMVSHDMRLSEKFDRTVQLADIATIRRGGTV